MVHTCPSCASSSDIAALRSTEVAELNSRLDRKKQECLALQQEIHNLEHRASATERVARERFHLCREGEQIFLYTE